MTSPALVRVHRYVALGLGVLVVAMGLTGASLVFRDELTAFFTPAVKVSAAPVAAGEYARIVAAVRSTEPDAKSMDIVPSARVDRAMEVIAYRSDGSEHNLFVDPHDGKVVADGEREWLPFAAFFHLHRRFLLGPAGANIVGIAGLTLAFLAVTGLVLWWPRKLAQAFRIRWTGNRIAVSYDLHRCAGAAFALLLLLNAVTGASMAFDGASSALVNFLARSPEPAPIPAASANAMRSARPLDEIVAAAERAFPGGVVSRVEIHEGDAPVVVRKRAPGDQETHGMNRIYVDAGTATVLRVSPLADLSPGHAMFEWLYPLHTGKLIGFPYKLVLIVAGLVPSLSLVTGLILWRSRAKRRAVASPVKSRAMDAVR